MRVQCDIVTIIKCRCMYEQGLLSVHYLSVFRYIPNYLTSTSEYYLTLCSIKNELLLLPSYVILFPGNVPLICWFGALFMKFISYFRRIMKGKRASDVGSLR